MYDPASSPSHIPVRQLIAQRLLQNIATRANCTPDQILSGSRLPNLFEARQTYCWALYRLGYRTERIAACMHRTESSVEHTLDRMTKHHKMLRTTADDMLMVAQYPDPINALEAHLTRMATPQPVTTAVIAYFRAAILNHPRIPPTYGVYGLHAIATDERIQNKFFDLLRAYALDAHQTRVRQQAAKLGYALS